MCIDTAKIIELLWENWAINNRVDFLNKMKQAIPDIILLTPQDPLYKTPIDLKIFIKEFKTYTLGINEFIKITQQNIPDFFRPESSSLGLKNNLNNFSKIL